MLTSLNFLKVGQQFPPSCEKQRLDKYHKNKLIFEGNHEQVYHESFKRIKRVINNFDDVVSYSVIANYQKLVSLKIADLMLGEPPRILCGDDNSKQQQTIEEIKENSDLINTLYSSCIDLSRFGDSVFLIYKDDNNKPVIDITQPSFYFKVVDEKNIKKVVNHVLAHTYFVEVPGSLFSKPKKEKYLYVQIHYKGYYEEFTCKLSEQNIITNATETTRISTGLNDFAVVPVHNLLTSDRTYGLDDYADLDSIISELEVRVSQIAKILDKHAEPSMQGPETALTQNEYGQWVLKTGNYFPKHSEDSDVSYITWDAQLTANFEIIEKLINMLSTISEMGSAIFDTQEKTGNVASGIALRRMMISPLAKVNRVRMRFDSAIKKALKLASQYTNTNLEDEIITIHWQDGLPNDAKEEAEIMAIRTGNKSTLSQWSAIQRLDNLRDEEVNKELEAIKQDEINNNPLSNMNFDYGTNEEENNEVVD